MSNKVPEEYQKKVQEFQKAEMEKFIEVLVKAAPPSDSDVIYHYTGQEGLLGILKSARIFASDLRFMNDHTERKFADRYIDQLIDTDQDLGKFLEPLTDRSPVQLEIPEYAACFSEDGDSLAQWRMYAGFNGYAIGWKQEAIVGMAAASPTMTRVLPCCYDVVVQKEALETAIQNIKTFVLENDFSDVVSSYLFSNVIWTARSFYKHPSFSYEREMRFITFEHRNQTGEDNDYQFSVRPGRNNLIPFVRVPVPTPEEIVIGPSAHPLRAKQALDELLIRGGFKTVTTRVSSAPFVEF